jgi:protein-S-isoprenylcysteine O-methyltransferase Ste14
MHPVFTALRAVLFGTVFLVFWLWVALRIQALDRYLGASLPAWTLALGFLTIAGGATLVAVCIVLFVVQGLGTPAPFDAPKRFVAVGPYRIIRNPMYIGGLLLLAGFGLFQHSKAILLFCPLWLLGAHLFVTLYEEPVLKDKFGTSYLGYCRAVPRWIPKW